MQEMGLVGENTNHRGKVKAESLKPKGNSISIMDLLIGKNSPVIILKGNTNQ